MLRTLLAGVPLGGLWPAVLLWFVAGTVSAGPTAQELGAEFVSRTWQAEIDGNRIRLRGQAKVIVYSPRGVDYGRLVVSENSFADFKRARMTVRDTAGVLIRELSKKDMTKACGYGASGLYDDACTYWSDLEAAAFPYVVDYEYELEHQSLFFWRSVQFQRGVPVQEAVYELSIPTEQSFHYKSYDLDLAVDSSRQSDRMRYRWRATDIPAGVFPDGTPGSAQAYGRLELVADSFELEGYSLTGVSWRSIGDWYRRMAADRYLPVAFEPVADPAAALAEVFTEVTDRTRYVSVQIGVGGWQPYAAELTATRGYGDCKDMTTLLLSRLRAVGIECHPVLVRTRNLTPIDVTFPTLEFNHVIAMAQLGPDTIWLDPTCSLCEPGDLPVGDEALDVLVVTDSGGVLRRTPAARPRDNHQLAVTSFAVHEDWSFTVTCSTTYSGDPGRTLRAVLQAQTNEERAVYLAERFDMRENKCELKDWRLHGLSDRRAPMRVVVEAESLRPLRVVGGTLYVNPFLFCRPAGRIREPLGDRLTPLQMDGIQQRRDSIMITWPAALAVESIGLPDTVSGAHESGSFATRAVVTENGVAVMFERVNSWYAVAPSAFDSFGAYREALERSLKSYLKLGVATSR